MAQSNLRREIGEQVEVLGRLVQDGPRQVEPIVERLLRRPPRFGLFAARGTSDNAATYGKYVLGSLNGLVVGLAAPSLITVYHRKLDLREGLVIGISQSGQGLDVAAVLDEARRQGAYTLAITNTPGSPIVHAAEAVIELGAGPERSIAASKTYTGELTALALLAACWGGHGELLAQLGELPGWVDESLRAEQAAAACAREFSKATTLVCVSRGYNHATSYETALKIKELSYVAALAYSAADFRHGPIAMLDEGFPVVAIAPQGEAMADMSALLDEIRPTGARLAVMSSDPSLLAATDLQIRLPAGMAEWLSPVVCAVPGQLLALHLALERGFDPDRPRGLHKVTLTR